MSNDLNQCNFIGRLGADPETRYTPSGEPICNFRIAVGWKTKDKEGAEWVSITAFSKLAEICGQYLKKGSQVFVSGRMKTDEYEKDGVKRYSTKIVADRMQMLGGRGDAGGGQSSGEPQQRQQQQRQQGNGGGQQQRQSAPQSRGFDDFEDDIPF